MSKAAAKGTAKARQKSPPQRSLTITEAGVSKKRRKTFESHASLGSKSFGYTKWKSLRLEEEPQLTSKIELFESNAKFIAENFLSNASSKKNPKLCLFWAYYKELTHSLDSLQLRRRSTSLQTPIKRRKTEEQSTIEQQLRRKSAFSAFSSLKIRAVIVKHGDDMRQELFAMHLICVCRDIFVESGLPLYLRPYEITICGKDSGLIEFIPGTCSISSLKKMHKGACLRQIFWDRYGAAGFNQAQANFTHSLAGYSLVCYLLQIKDRHNGNILLDSEGRLIHIDFGFFISNFPGSILSIERAPFKLTEVIRSYQEYLELLTDQQRCPDNFDAFCELLQQGLAALQKHAGRIIQYVRVIMNDCDFDCFSNFQKEKFLDRFALHLKDKPQDVLFVLPSSQS